MIPFRCFLRGGRAVARLAVPPQKEACFLPCPPAFIIAAAAAFVKEEEEAAAFAVFVSDDEAEKAEEAAGAAVAASAKPCGVGHRFDAIEEEEVAPIPPILLLLAVAFVS